MSPLSPVNKNIRSGVQNSHKTCASGLHVKRALVLSAAQWPEPLGQHEDFSIQVSWQWVLGGAGQHRFCLLLSASNWKHHLLDGDGTSTVLGKREFSCFVITPNGKAWCRSSTFSTPWGRGVQQLVCGSGRSGTGRSNGCGVKRFALGPWGSLFQSQTAAEINSSAISTPSHPMLSSWCCALRRVRSAGGAFLLQAASSPSHLFVFLKPLYVCGRMRASALQSDEANTGMVVVMFILYSACA